MNMLTICIDDDKVVSFNPNLIELISARTGMNEHVVTAKFTSGGIEVLAVCESSEAMLESHLVITDMVTLLKQQQSQGAYPAGGFGQSMFQQIPTGHYVLGSRANMVKYVPIKIGDRSIEDTFKAVGFKKVECVYSNFWFGRMPSPAAMFNQPPGPQFNTPARFGSAYPTRY